MAFVVSRPDSPHNAVALDRLCLEEIAGFKRPKHYRFVAALPKNNYGKVLKTELRAMLGRGRRRRRRARDVEEGVVRASFGQRRRVRRRSHCLIYSEFRLPYGNSIN